MDALKTIANGSLKENAPQFGIGDTVRVDVKIREGDRERIQAFEGTVIAKRGQRRGRNLYRAPRLLWRGCGESLPAALPQCGGREGWFVTAKYAAASCTTCAIASANPRRSKSA